MTCFSRSLAIVAIIIYFLIGYASAMQGHSSHEAFDWSISLDSKLPLIPWFLVFYLLGYIYLFIPCFVLSEKKDFQLYMITMFIIMSASFLLFTYFPAIMTKEISTGESIIERLLYFMQTRDTNYNNFPSLHVSLNTFSFLILFKTGKPIWKLSGIVVFLIIVSTMLVKQHLVVDVVSGCLFAGIAYKFYSLALKNINDRAMTILNLIAMLIMTTAISLEYQLLEFYINNFLSIPSAIFT